MVVLASESWTGINGTPWPAQWTVTPNTATYDIQSNQGRLLSGAGSYSGGTSAYLASMVAVADCDLTVTMALPTVAEGFLSASVRSDGVAGVDVGLRPDKGYALVVSGTGTAVTIEVARHTGANKVTVSPVFTAPALSSTYRLQAIGAALKMKTWTSGTAEPSVWTWEGADASPYLTAGKVYLSALNGAAGGALDFRYDDFVVSDIPITPTNLVATAVSPTQVDLTWTAVAGARSYQVERAGEVLTRVAATSYSDTGLTASTAYTYRVRAEK